MNLDITLSRYKDVHEQILPAFLSGFSKEILSQSYGKLNPPLWILWHMARCEDFGINRLANDGIQVFHKENWKSKLNISTDKMGTGMSKEDVKNICQTLNFSELENYRLAVFKNNLRIANQIRSEDLSLSRDNAYLNKVLFDEGLIDRSISNILPVYQNKTREWFILHTLVAHNYYHLGQLSFIKQLLG